MLHITCPACAGSSGSCLPLIYQQLPNGFQQLMALQHASSLLQDAVVTVMPFHMTCTTWKSPSDRPADQQTGLRAWQLAAQQAGGDAGWQLLRA